jgi:hypothetical protein
MKTVIKSHGRGSIEVDPVELPGACSVGRGKPSKKPLATS